MTTDIVRILTKPELKAWCGTRIFKEQLDFLVSRGIAYDVGVDGVIKVDVKEYLRRMVPVENTKRTIPRQEPNYEAARRI